MDLDQYIIGIKLFIEDLWVKNGIFQQLFNGHIIQFDKQFLVYFLDDEFVGKYFFEKLSIDFLLL